MAKLLPSQEHLIALLRYELSTGKLFWRERPLSLCIDSRVQRSWNTQNAGAEALAIKRRGYYYGCIDGVTYQTHRIIWKMVYGSDPEFIDHINGDPLDNRLVNLRSVIEHDNHKNQKKFATNTSGITGVRWKPSHKKWIASIHVEKHRKFLGYFASKDEAITVRRAAEVQYGYHPNHGLER
jgi:hypothetical protein